MCLINNMKNLKLNFSNLKVNSQIFDDYLIDLSKL